MARPTRTIVMTGASRGIGRRAAISILREAPDVALVVLARAHGEDLTEQLCAESGNSNVSAVPADLDSMASIRAATASLRGDLGRGVLPPLAGFVGNAGIQLTRATERSVDGVEATFAVNVLANHVLVDGLRAEFTIGARIVVTTSDTHFGDFTHTMGMVPAPVWRDPRDLAIPGTAVDAAGATAGRRAYSTSKLALIYWVHALARRLPESMTVYSFNPGLVPGTGLVRDAGTIVRFAFARIMPVLTLTPLARSAATSGHDLAAAVLASAPAPSGAYLNGTKPEASSPESYDHAREEALWDELVAIQQRAG